MADSVVLLGDIGGTNARFALFANDRLGPLAWLRVAAYPSFASALSEFLGREGQPPVRAAIFAVAGPVKNNRAQLTNHAWAIDGPQLAELLGIASVRVINDFEATAWSLPHLGIDHLAPLGGGQAVAGAPMAVLGPGTGLGVAAFVPGPCGGTVLATEGGHATLPSTSHEQDQVVELLRRRFGHVSGERAVSGGGLEHLYWAMAELGRVQADPKDAAQITHSALAGSCLLSQGVLAMFCAFLGSIAGNVALTFGARGGVFLAGGIPPRILEFLQGSAFRECFEAKGRSRSYLEAIPTHVVIHPDATFVGLELLAAHVAEQL